MRPEEEADFIDHLSELRTRLLRCILYVCITSSAAWYVYPWVYRLLTDSITKPLKEMGGRLIATTPLESFYTQFQVTLVAGCVLVAPLLFYELWAFIVPGLTHRERRAVRPLLPLAMLLFLGGVAMAYAILPLCWSWLLSFTPPDVLNYFPLNQYVVLMAKLFLTFGLCFQLPIVILFLVKIGLFNHASLCKYRRHAILAITIIAAIVTPTWDIFTMLAVAIPMGMLYELSIWLVRLLEKGKKDDEAGADL